jgi:Mn-dependent DtxR family transcriptional regulator
MPILVTGIESVVIYACFIIKQYAHSKRMEFLVRYLQVSKLTAANYLNKLAEDGVLKKQKIGRGNYYVNEDLFNLMIMRKANKIFIHHSVRILRNCSFT